mgnify:FL=1|tara:strand:+ start:27 stop:1187 length:1161 start_codon:yes stop_codon:yes gene_type:complete
MAAKIPGNGIDANGQEIILDADADTSITADTDDQIDIKIAGADDFQFTANTFTAQSGSTITTPTLGVGDTKDLGAGIHIKVADSGVSAVNSAADELVLENSASCGLSIFSGTSEVGKICFGDSGDNNNGEIVYSHANLNFVLTANGSEKFKLGGTYAIIGDAMTNNNNQALQVYESGSNIECIRVNHSQATNAEGIRVTYTDGSPDDANGNCYDFFDTTAGRFAVRNDGDVVNHDNSYGSISDERIKEDIKDANSQWNDIKNIKIRNYKKKDDVRQYGDNAWEQIGVIAQELETVSPKLIKENKPSIGDIKSNSAFGTLWTADDQEVKDGNANEGEVKEIKEQVKSVKYSVLYMKAIKALQEAMAKIEALETSNTDLKNRVTALEG